MTRALTMQRTIVPAGDRKKYHERLRARRGYYQGAHCRFWVFEEHDLPGAFIEFVEADDPQALVRALDSAPDPYPAGIRVYQEMELD